MKKKWIVSGIIVIALIYVLYGYHRPQYVELSFNSVIFSLDSDFEKSIEVSMKGELYKSLVGNGMFRGELSAEEDLKYNVKLTEEGNLFEGFIIVKDSNKNTIIIGTVNVSPKLDKIWIQLDDVNERYSLTEGYIAGPASNVSKAKQIASMIFEGK
ncbi:hypothetical protein [Paenibacillus endoradicis]|uniref:hypothetical protein n=1 Tax=Paenibacillus endoradicis TaxID=2972487 RepID=UPI00215906ED|nr:hypothetical protein [Paenibacillus endoradicis]MCR8656235.1 hypothetical protein [Paenibacillus endoradicis]